MSKTDDPIAAAEKRGYAKGYRAGKERKARDIDALRKWREENAQFNRLFIACLPTCIDTNGWTQGDKPITDISGRTKLARDFANEGMKYLRPTR